MSFRVYGKGRGKRRSLYLLGLSWELLFLIPGVAVALCTLLLRRFGVIF